MPEFLFLGLDELKESSTDSLDDITAWVDELQARIEEINIIHNYLQNDPDMVLKYGSQVAELFGKVNALTLVADEMILNINGVVVGEYDHYPEQVIASFVMVWDMRAQSTLESVQEHIEQLERYIEYFKAINDDVGLEIEYKSKPTVH